MRNETVAAIMRWELLLAAGVRPEHLDGNGDVFPGQVDKDGILEYLQKSKVQRLHKEILGINVRNYLEPGRKRKNGTRVPLINNKPIHVPLHEDGTFHDPMIEDLFQDNVIDIVAAGLAARSSKKSQPIRLIQEIARQIGLKFTGKQSRSGDDRGKRVYRLDMKTVARMLDIGENDWNRLNSTPIPAAMDDDIEAILDMVAG